MNRLSLGARAWIAFGALIALCGAVMVVRELPAIRREMRILNM